MSTLGWLVMVVSVGSVLLLNVFCLYRVLTLPPADVDDLTYPLEVDTKDTAQPD
jgi:hypothetical protein